MLSISFGPGRSTVVTLAGTAASEITSRRSTWPSATAVVSNRTDHGAETSVPIVVQVPAPCGEYWNATDATPAPGSLGDGSERTTVPARTEPGSAGAPLGGCVSIVTVACRTASVLPTLSTGVVVDRVRAVVRVVGGRGDDDARPALPAAAVDAVARRGDARAGAVAGRERDRHGGGLRAGGRVVARRGRRPVERHRGRGGVGRVAGGVGRARDHRVLRSVGQAREIPCPVTASPTWRPASRSSSRRRRSSSRRRSSGTRAGRCRSRRCRRRSPRRSRSARRSRPRGGEREGARRRLVDREGGRGGGLDAVQVVRRAGLHGVGAVCREARRRERVRPGRRARREDEHRRRARERAAVPVVAGALANRELDLLDARAGVVGCGAAETAGGRPGRGAVEAGGGWERARRGGSRATVMLGELPRFVSTPPTLVFDFACQVAAPAAAGAVAPARRCRTSPSSSRLLRASRWRP